MSTRYYDGEHRTLAEVAARVEKDARDWLAQRCAEYAADRTSGWITLLDGLEIPAEVSYASSMPGPPTRRWTTNFEFLGDTAVVRVPRDCDERRDITQAWLSSRSWCRATIVREPDYSLHLEMLSLDQETSARVREGIVASADATRASIRAGVVALGKLHPGDATSLEPLLARSLAEVDALEAEKLAALARLTT